MTLKRSGEPPAVRGILHGSQVLAGLRHGGINVTQTEADDVVVGISFTVGGKAQHPSGSPPAADRVALVPDEHRRQLAVEDGVARIEIILKSAAAEVGQDDHPDSGKFLVVELAD